ncbi:MAG: hypothetical protein ACLGI2_16150 [Acidimicrobiia bacterium]
MTFNLEVTISQQAFLADSHGARYRDVAENHPDAFAALLTILSDPTHQAGLVAAEHFGLPALSGVVQAVESDAHIVKVLRSSGSGRFRQAVGVAVRLTMGALGWSTTGRKGPVRGAAFFKRAERYRAPENAPSSPESGARGALEAVGTIGDEEERARTGSELLAALAATRRAEHRPF